jgi:hypothetical protein
MPGPGYFSLLSSLKGTPVKSESQRLEAFAGELKAAFAYSW